MAINEKATYVIGITLDPLRNNITKRVDMDIIVDNADSMEQAERIAYKAFCRHIEANTSVKMPEHEQLVRQLYMFRDSDTNYRVGISYHVLHDGVLYADAAEESNDPPVISMQYESFRPKKGDNDYDYPNMSLVFSADVESVTVIAESSGGTRRRKYNIDEQKTGWISS